MKNTKKGKKAKVAVEDLEVKKVKGGMETEDPKGGFNPQPEPPPLSHKGVQIGTAFPKLGGVQQNQDFHKFRR